MLRRLNYSQRFVELIQLFCSVPYEVVRHESLKKIGSGYKIGVQSNDQIAMSLLEGVVEVSCFGVRVLWSCHVEHIAVLSFELRNHCFFQGVLPIVTEIYPQQLFGILDLESAEDSLTNNVNVLVITRNEYANGRVFGVVTVQTEMRGMGEVWLDHSGRDVLEVNAIAFANIPHLKNFENNGEHGDGFEHKKENLVDHVRQCARSVKDGDGSARAVLQVGDTDCQLNEKQKAVQHDATLGGRRLLGPVGRH